MKTHSIGRSMAIALILSTFAAVGTFAQGGNGNGSKDKGRGEKLQQALAQLDLTDQQKAEIARLQDAFKANNEAAINEVKTLRETMKAQRKSGDKTGAQATKEQLKAKQMGLKESSRELRNQIMAVLTDQQKAQLQQMKGQRGKKNKS